ncbi:hypothetical protein LG3211_1368 [Lysobacter gummosus]|nr:hypothetical protein LG3211_1368 [Lysobacter gummosus]
MANRAVRLSFKPVLRLLLSLHRVHHATRRGVRTGLDRAGPTDIATRANRRCMEATSRIGIARCVSTTAPIRADHGSGSQM